MSEILKSQILIKINCDLWLKMLEEKQKNEMSQKRYVETRQDIVWDSLD